MEGDRAKQGSSRRRFRVAFAGVFYALTAAFVIAATAQITQQVFFASPGTGGLAACDEGLAALNGALSRARTAAPGTDGEDAAVQRFRAALMPEWTERDAVARLCSQTPNDRAALDAIERLRYAEEHAARREAHELAPLRRRVEAIGKGLGPSQAPAPSPQSP